MQAQGSRSGLHPPIRSVGLVCGLACVHPKIKRLFVWQVQKLLFSLGKILDRSQTFRFNLFHIGNMNKSQTQSIPAGIKSNIFHFKIYSILTSSLKTDMENSSTHTHARITDLFSSKVAWGIRRFAQEDYDLDIPSECGTIPQPPEHVCPIHPKTPGSARARSSSSTLARGAPLTTWPLDRFCWIGQQYNDGTRSIQLIVSRDSSQRAKNSINGAREELSLWPLTKLPKTPSLSVKATTPFLSTKGLKQPRLMLSVRAQAQRSRVSFWIRL